MPIWAIFFVFYAFFFVYYLMSRELLDKRLLEAKAVLWSLGFYKSILDFIVGFLLSAIILQTLGYSIWYGIVPAAIFALLHLVREFWTSDIVGALQGKYDQIDERLLTALEHKSTKGNIIVEDLFSDVSKRFDQVESSSFFNMREISWRIYFTVFLCFLFLTASVINLRSMTFNSLDFLLGDSGLRDALQKITGDGDGTMMFSGGDRWEQSNYSTEDHDDMLGAQSGGETPGINEGPIPGVGGGTGSDSPTDIYGDAESASIIGRDTDFKLRPEYGGDVEIREVGSEISRKQFILDDVLSVEECADCTVGPENEELVRKYFEHIIPTI
jgi:hypothetical protein